MKGFGKVSRLQTSLRALLEGFAEVSGILRDLRKVLERFLIGWTGLPKGIKGGPVRFRRKC